MLKDGPVDEDAKEAPEDSSEEAIPPYRPELVFGLVTPVGTPSSDLRDALEQALRGYGYEPISVRLSDLLAGRAEELGVEPRVESEDARIQYLMDVGDRLCSDAASAAAVLWEAIAEVGVVRESLPDLEPPSARAWILDSLKRPEEVNQLRYIYGDHVFILSAQATDETRRATLGSKIAPRRPGSADDETDALVRSLVARDKDDPTAAYGQNVLKTFPLADVFIDCDSDAAHQTQRFVDLLFRNPQGGTPTVEEYGMSLASVGASMSPELGLKVGAAILHDRSVIALGTNAHPVASESAPEFDRSKLDIARLALDAVERLSNAGLLSKEASEKLAENGDSFTSELLEGALKGSQIAGLTEFQLPVHAEMSALLDALSQSKSVRNATVYVTAYPCHNCAKHLLRCELVGVYLEPYPKSRAEAMYGYDAKSAFRPFTGVAPRFFTRLFGEASDRMDAVGARISWGAKERAVAEPAVEFADESSIRKREYFAAGKRVEAPQSECRTLGVDLADTDSGSVGGAPNGE